MTSWTFILRSLLFHRRIHVAVALGVAAATAVLTGALLVGDSVRGSLRHLTLDRLGRIDEALITDRFFRQELGDELSQSQPFRQHYDALAPALLFPSVTLEKTSGTARRAANVLAIASDERFWSLGDPAATPTPLPGDDEIVLNQPLAEALEAEVGDEVVLRLPQASDVPADSTLARKDDRIRSLAGLKVVAIVPAESLGRFALRPNQSLPRNAYLSLPTLQAALGQPDQVNALFLAGKSATQPPSDQASQALSAAIAPALADFGIRVDRIRRTFQPEGEDEQVIYDYFHVTTDRMIFSPAAEEAVTKALADYQPQRVLTYLANTIAKDGEPLGIPYSTVSAVDSIPDIGPALLDSGEPARLGDNEIALNQWAADDLGVQPGDTIRLNYFSPETTHGVPAEEHATFTLKAIVPLTEPVAGFSRRRPARYGEPPTTANDPDLTPVVAGITDQQSIDDWDPPFPFDQKRVRTQDDTYWENHRTTPKAFVSLAAGQTLWGSRFGQVTSFRIPARAGLTEAELRSKLLGALRQRQQDLGFALLPVKRQGLLASSGATPFDVLFLFLSFFIIAAALMLVAVLFKLGVQQRVREVGTLLALGWEQRQTRRVLLLEGVYVSAAGALVGVALGVGYAWLMLAGLRTWWVGAITTPFLTLHITPRSLAIGLVSGVIVSLLTIAWSLRQLRSLSARQLLAGVAETDLLVKRRGWLWPAVAGVLFLIAIVLALLATQLGGEAQAGAFVGAGAAVLTSLLVLIWDWLRAPRPLTVARASRLALRRLALAAAQRNPTRSTLTIGLVAAASFLILSMSLFRLDPTRRGAGGFDLVATTSEPVFADLNSPAGRETLFGEEQPAALQGVTVLALRYRPGDDASCNNLYQAQQPRVLGVTSAMVAHYDDPQQTSFDWAASAASEADQQNPWRLLQGPAAAEGEPIPVVIDKNTAMYSLHKYGGIGEEFSITYEDGTTLRVKVVGLLSNSILQGSLLIGEANFLRHFPAIGGYRYFLVQASPERLESATTLLEDRLSDQGFAAESTEKLLADLLAVQNTYLSTFQSLGALGLLLGTFGLATVQLRSVLERRGELALLRASGFRNARIAALVMLESLLLLLGGLLTGVLAALVAVLPHMLLTRTQVQLEDLAALLGMVLLVGIASSLLAVRATLQSDIIAALRGE